MYTAEDIYDTLLGDLVEWARVPGVENLFQEGKPCYENFVQAMNAYEILFGDEENREIETMIDAFLANQKLIALKMFEYGLRLAQNKPRL